MTTKRIVFDMRFLIAIMAVTGIIAVSAVMTAMPGSTEAHGDEPELRLSASETEPGDIITVQASRFREGTEASFIYASSITIGGVPVAGVASVDAASGYFHAGRVTDSGIYIAEHIDIDPADTAPDGAFTADIVVLVYVR